ncbi:MmcQ/YjbR family DNA-binding protein [Aliamphritea ceti]|uniref:MmcQ/YjbR family DNA-binding protein n=1 Tax=Aliamphritea ceti TaxID=1524258 RepID=UPI0021C29717|nr:MmcQ/YjbR family DNA-binding protein [Aliamphritea ceti]
MTPDDVKQYCSRLLGSESKLSGAPANILTYKIGGKKFAYFKTSEPEQWRFSVRVTPEQYLELTDQPGIKPARYMHRFHWISIVHVAQLPDDYLQLLIEDSYTRAFNTLSKKVREAIINNE